MTSLKVHTPLPEGVSSSDLNALLIAAGLTASSPDEWVVNCPDGDGVPVLLVMAVGDAAAALESAVRAAVSRGERVIAMWPLGTKSSILAPVFEDYGAGLIIWDQAALHAAICGQEVEWQDTGGGARAPRALERNSNC